MLLHIHSVWGRNKFLKINQILNFNSNKSKSVQFFVLYGCSSHSFHAPDYKNKIENWNDFCTLFHSTDSIIKKHKNKFIKNWVRHWLTVDVHVKNLGIIFNYIDICNLQAVKFSIVSACRCLRCVTRGRKFLLIV
jgi:hypothetical protein